jgi:hypothetical protein
MSCKADHTESQERYYGYFQEELTYILILFSWEQIDTANNSK